jgi:alanine dehydrogenase
VTRAAPTALPVTNMPDAVSQTSSVAMPAAILPVVQRLATGKQGRRFHAQRRGINGNGGQLVHPAVKGMV